jgi:hypothetical protein
MKTMKQQAKVLKMVKPPRRTVSESEALEFIKNTGEWRKKKLAEWRKKGPVSTAKPIRKN